MPDATVPDLEALARDLATATANLKRHIEAEGLKIGAALGKNHAKAADERIKAVTDQAAIEIQRRDDVIAELRLQLEYQAQTVQRLREAEATLRRVQAVKAWRDDLGRGFVFVDELGHAINPDTYPAPVPVRLEREAS